MVLIMSDVMADIHTVTKKKSIESQILLHRANVLGYIHSICKYFRTRAVSKVIFCLTYFVLNLSGENTFVGMRSLAC